MKQGIQRHIQETQQQIRNVEQCFQKLGMQPKQIGCPGAEGIVREYQTGLRDISSPELVDMFTLGSAARGEHYEIAAYTGLIEGAREMGDQQCVQLLEQNLRQEQRFAQECEQLKAQIGQQVTSGAPRI